MASHFNANQYENAFDSKRLRNWQLPKTYKERPSAQDGFTHIIANDRGHLLEGVSRSNDSPWGRFVGTWDMPKKIPGNVTTTMARSKPAVSEIERSKLEHETFMRQATGSPVKETELNQTSTSPTKSTEERPGKPSPQASPEIPASKSPEIPASKSPEIPASKSPATPTVPKTPNPSLEDTSQAPATETQDKSPIPV